MKKSSFYLFLVLVCLIVAATVYANDFIETSWEKPLIVSVQSADEPDRGIGTNRSIQASPSQRYIIISDNLDGFGGESKSTGYEIPYSSEGQTFRMGIMESSNYQAKSGYIWAIDINLGDGNQDGIINIGDVVYMINYLFRGGDQPIPLETGDINCDGDMDVGDVVYLINYLFGQGPPPCN